VSSSNFWVKDENFFWLWVSIFVEILSNVSGGSLVGTSSWSSGGWSWIFLNKGSRDWGWWVKSRWVGWGDVSRSLVWLSGGWLGVVVWNSSWLFSSACSTGWSIEWSVCSIADGSSAVSSIKSVGSSANWEWSGRFDNNWNPLLFSLKILDFGKSFFASSSIPTSVGSVANWKSTFFINWSVFNITIRIKSAWWAI